jgi:hypothetical protein
VTGTSAREAADSRFAHRRGRCRKIHHEDTKATKEEGLRLRRKSIVFVTFVSSW